LLSPAAAAFGSLMEIVQEILTFLSGHTARFQSFWASIYSP